MLLCFEEHSTGRFWQSSLRRFIFAFGETNLEHLRQHRITNLLLNFPHWHPFFLAISILFNLCYTIILFAFCYERRGMLLWEYRIVFEPRLLFFNVWAEWKSYQSLFQQMSCLLPQTGRNKIAEGEKTLSVTEPEEKNLNFNVENIKLKQNPTKFFHDEEASKFWRFCKFCYHICMNPRADPKIAAFSAGCERPVWRIVLRLMSGAQRGGHLPQEHMGQPGFDEMRGDGCWDLWRGPLELRSNYGCGGLGKQGDSAHIFPQFFNIDLNM